VRKFIPLADRILVLPERAPAKTTGLAQPKSQEAEPTEGVVVATGPEVRCQCGLTDCPVSGGEVVRVGDRVQWRKYAGHPVQHNGVEHKLLRLEEIDGLVEDEDEVEK